MEMSSSLRTFWLLLVWNCIVMFRVARADCTVQDANGRPINIHDENRPLPSGVFFDYEYDRIRCMGDYSCANWSISECFVVQCKGKQSCQGVKFRNNQGIACWANAACENAYMYKSHNVACGVETKNACRHAVVETDTVVLCYGLAACVSENYQTDKIIFKVGHKGRIRCENDDPGDTPGLACQNMVVEIDHAKRACFSRNIYETKHCAVICQGAHVCDRDTIFFKVA